MRESFVFHDKYIRGVPAELLGEFCTLIVKYGLYGEEPKFTDWRDQKIWSDIKERIDTDAEAYSQKVSKRRLYDAANHFKNGRATDIEIEILRNNGFDFSAGKFGNCQKLPNVAKSCQKLPRFATTDTRREYESDPDSVSESEFEYESVGNEAFASTETTADFSTEIPQKKKAETKEPSLDDVKSYIEEKDLNVNEADFWDYYSGSPGKDWKRMLLSWSRRERNPEARKSNNAAKYDFARKGG